ncbi:Sialin [Lamellibrachia satsuma]|nr:Sialin [Lamellibrachia satsuma]
MYGCSNVLDCCSVYRGAVKPYPLLCSCRLLLAIIGFFCFVLNYAQRIAMSVTIVAMVNHTALRLLHDDDDISVIMNGSTTGGEVAYYNNNSGVSTTQSLDGPFMWTKTAQGHVLGAFFYGYLMSQVPAGMLAEHIGGKWVFTGIMALTAIPTLLTPPAANISYKMLIVLRVLVGIGSGGIFPVMHVMWSQWSPPLERSKLTGITYAGAMMGSVVALPLSGMLCQHGFAGGWPSVFYLFGGATLVMMVIWVVLVSDSPETARKISSEERTYIMTSLKPEKSADSRKRAMPWLSFLKSGPLWAIIVANFTSDWGLYTLLTNIPTYIRDVLHLNIQSNGFFSALPFLGLWLNMNISPIIADKLRSSHVLNTTRTRKLFNSIGQVGAAMFLVALAYLDHTQSVLAIALLTIGVAVSGSAYSGFLINHIDLAPKYAGTLFGISNCIAATSGFMTPYVAAVLTPNRTREEWQVVFFIAAAVYSFGAIFYCIFGSGDIQTWAVDKDVIDAGELNSLTQPQQNGDSAKQQETSEHV